MPPRVFTARFAVGRPNESNWPYLLFIVLLVWLFLEESGGPRTTAEPTAQESPKIVNGEVDVDSGPLDRPAAVLPAGAKGKWKLLPNTSFVSRVDGPASCGFSATTTLGSEAFDEAVSERFQYEVERLCRRTGARTMAQQRVGNNSNTKAVAGDNKPTEQPHSPSRVDPFSLWYEARHSPKIASPEPNRAVVAGTVSSTLREEMVSSGGDITLKSLTNISSHSVGLAMIVQFGRYSDAKKLAFRLKGQETQFTGLGGGANRGNAGSGGLVRQFVLFGHGMGLGSSSPFLKKFVVGKHRPGRAWLNASTVRKDFEAALRMTTNSTFRSKLPRQESTLGECLWFGVLQLEREASKGSNPNPANFPDDVFTGHQLRGIVTSTCNVSFSFTAKVKDFEEKKNQMDQLSLAMFIALPFGLLAYVGQHSAMRDSRGRTLRYSIFSTAWILAYDFLGCVALIGIALTYPSLAKAAGVVSIFWFVQFCVYGCRTLNMLVTAYRLQTESYSWAMNKMLERPFLSLYLALMFLSFVASQVGISVLYSPVAALVCWSFFVPQIIHGVLEGDLNPIDNSYVILMALNKLIPLWYYEFSTAGSTFPEFEPNAFVGIGVTLWVGLQAGMLWGQSTKGSRAIVPPFLRPKKYCYSNLDSTHISAILESPDCPICQMPLTAEPQGEAEREAPTNVGASPTGSGGGEGGGGAVTRREPKGPGAGSPQQQAPAESTGSEAAAAYTGVWATPCSHFFHADCLMDWMEERLECPICRSRLPKP